MSAKSGKWSAMVELFLFYSIIGWIYEEILEVFIYRTGFTNRGFLFGPYLPVYGFGALLFLCFLYPMKQKRCFSYATPLVVFLGSMLIATTVELITSYGLSYFHLELWNYDKYPFNFQGRIALNPSIRFGIGGVIFLYLLQPLFDKIIAKQSSRTLNLTAAVILLILLIDFAFQVI